MDLLVVDNDAKFGATLAAVDGWRHRARRLDAISPNL